MEPLIISNLEFKSFKIPFVKPFLFAGHTVQERGGFYCTFHTGDGRKVQTEAAPLDGISPETSRRVLHDLKDSQAYFKNFKFPIQKDALLELLKHDPHVLNLCPSVRLAVESAVFLLAAQANQQSLVEFLGAELKDVQTAILLQGSLRDVITDAQKFSSQGAKVFKLKVGDRNIALDVKKVSDVRQILPEDSYLRLDANRQWSFKEACVFAELAGNQKIDYIEEPINDLPQLDAFYKKTRMRIGLDESMSVMRCGVLAPGRCASPLAQQDGVVAYVLKPMLLGFVPVLDWIEEAKMTKRKAIISSSFESPVGHQILASLAAVAGHVAGLGTERWFKNVKPIVGEDGRIRKENLI